MEASRRPPLAGAHVPDVRFGKPSIKGISTSVLREHDEAGEGIAEIAEAFGLAPDDVRWARAYENSARAA